MARKQVGTTPLDATDAVTKGFVETSTATLTNKTLTSPTITSPSITTPTLEGTATLNQASTAANSTLSFTEASTQKAYLQYRGTTAGTLPNTVRMQTPTGSNADIAIGANGNINIFVAGGQNGLNQGYVGVGGNLTPAVTLDVTGEARVSVAGTNATSVATVGGTQALTNKDLTSATNTLPTSLVTLTGTQTITNKTLTSPTITSPSITLPTINGDTTLNQASTAANSTLSLTEASTQKAYFQFRGTTAGTFPNTVRLQTSAATNADIMIGANTGTHIFVAGGQNGLTTGRVGISNSTPAVALDVTGEIRASTAGTNTASVVTVGGTQTLTNKIYIPMKTTTSGTTLTLTSTSSEVQEFTNSSAATLNLPTTGVVAGQTWTVMANGASYVSVYPSSGGGGLTTVYSGQACVFTARIDSPTANADWLHVSTITTANTIAQRDLNANLVARNFIGAKSSIATAAGTTTMTIASSPTFEFTGSTTQTVTLPTTSIIAGQSYTIINNSTGLLTVQSSGANTITTIPAGSSNTFRARIDTPTTAANWILCGIEPSVTSITAAAGTTTLTAASGEFQLVTGAAIQTIVLPSAVSAGRKFTIYSNVNSAYYVAVQASDATFLTNLSGLGWSATFTALQDTPTTYSHWGVSYPSQTFFRSTAVASSVALRDSNINLLSGNFIATKTSTATAAGTTTLTIASSGVQAFTGSTTQTVLLPTTSVVAGQSYTIINNSTGVLTVQSSGANTITTIPAGRMNTFLARIDTPTTAGNWSLCGIESIKSVVSVTSSVTLDSVAGRDYIVLVGASGAPTLPTAVGNGAVYTLKNTDTTSKSVATTSTQTIEGVQPYVLPAGASITVVSDNSNWRII